MGAGGEKGHEEGEEKLYCQVSFHVLVIAKACSQYDASHAMQGVKHTCACGKSLESYSYDSWVHALVVL